MKPFAEKQQEATFLGHSTPSQASLVRGGVCGYCPGVVGRGHPRGCPSPPAQPMALPAHSLLLSSHQPFKRGYLMQRLSYKSTLKHFLTIQAFGKVSAEDHIRRAMVGGQLQLLLVHMEAVFLHRCTLNSSPPCASCQIMCHFPKLNGFLRSNKVENRFLLERKQTLPSPILPAWPAQTTFLDPLSLTEKGRKEKNCLPR